MTLPSFRARVLIVAGALVCILGGLLAQVPLMIPHQGRLAVAGVPFHGTGHFKFALVSADGTARYWLSGPDTSPADGEPDAGIDLPVTRGLYHVQLGDPAVMTGLDPAALLNDAVHLRVWFNDGTRGFERLVPDRPLGSVAYALMARTSLAVAPDVVGSSALAADPASLGKVTGGILETVGGNVGVGTNAPSEKLEVAGRLVLGDSGNPAPRAGTLRWTGADFEGFTGSQWVSLTRAPVAATVTPRTNMVWIRPGSFVIGSPEFELERFADEGPQTTVTLTRGFWIGIYEVTQGEYQAVMGGNPANFGGNSNRPVERVSWFDAGLYCTNLTIQERSAGRIGSDWEYRLPTEAEWEYAARAGTTTRFSYGDDTASYTVLPNYGWFFDNALATTHPIGGKVPNPWGLFDCHGNVWEWCADRYGAYPGGNVVDPKGPAAGANRSLRGGSYFYGGRLARSAYRNRYDPTAVLIDIGFRVVLAEVPP